ncbi:MAG: alpha-glucuronidase family glycosyl hydrolase, partial [Bacteroidetes bacterium]|nr:alpha-glucuronidase family glycosyl hydrolase [Bacteroidota bacterium]
MRKFIVWISMLTAFTTVKGQPPQFTIQGRQVNLDRFWIVTPINPSAVEQKAAAELQKYFLKISGLKLTITNDQEKMRTCEFVIGRSNRVPESIDLARIDPDGFVIKNFGTRIVLSGGSHKGTLYAVYTFLEKYLGCRFYAPDAETVPVQKNIRLPELNDSGHPAFKDREVFYTVMEDQD